MKPHSKTSTVLPDDRVVKPVAKRSSAKLKGTPINLLIDSDIIAYRAAAACDGKYYTVGKEKFRYHKEASKYVCDFGFPKTDIKPHWDPEPLPYALKNIDRMLKKVKSACEDHIVRPVTLSSYLTHDKLFRADIEPLYKSSRIGLRKPHHLKDCKLHMEKKYGATALFGFEADDLIAIASTSIGKKDCIVVSLDKDLLQIPGLHYNFAKGTFSHVTEHDAMVNFWTQTMIGDKTDDIDGLYGVGPVGAKKVLKDLMIGASPRDFYKVVLDKYIAHNSREEGELDQDYFLRNIRQLTKTCKLLWLSRTYTKPQWEIPE